MIIKYHSTLYRSIRKTFYDNYEWGLVKPAFKNEVNNYNGKIIRVFDKPVRVNPELVDYLGMNVNYEIEFECEEKYTWFILKWA